jgi:hypothetical protein
MLADLATEGTSKLDLSLFNISRFDGTQTA